MYLNWLPDELWIRDLTYVPPVCMYPVYLHDTVHLATKTNSTHTFFIPTTNIKLAKQAFSISSPTTWNSIPLHMQQLTKTVVLK